MPYEKKFEGITCAHNGVINAGSLHDIFRASEPEEILQALILLDAPADICKGYRWSSKNQILTIVLIHSKATGRGFMIMLIQVPYSSQTQAVLKHRNTLPGLASRP